MNNSLYIHIERDHRRLHLCDAGQVVFTCPCAVGKPATPTPLGRFRIVNRVVLDGQQVYGTRWLGLDKPRYGIHGTNNPDSIGRAVSLGCVRLQNRDAERLYELVPVGTPVNITM